MIIKQPTLTVHRSSGNDDTFNRAGGQRALGDYLRGHRQMQREMHAEHPTAGPWLKEEPR